MVRLVVDDQQARAGTEIAEQASDDLGIILGRFPFRPVCLYLSVER